MKSFLLLMLICGLALAHETDEGIELAAKGLLLTKHETTGRIRPSIDSCSDYAWMHVERDFSFLRVPA